MLKVLISGSRNHLNEWGVRDYLESWILDQKENEFSMIHGDCPHPRPMPKVQVGKSVDLIGADVFKKYGKVRGFPADWNTHGKAAGMIRNKKMVDLGPDIVIAFPYGASPGTRNCVSIAKKAGIETIVVEEGDLRKDPDAPF